MKTVKSLRLAFVIKNITIHRGGIERVGVDLASAMAHRGHTVAIFGQESPSVTPVFPLHPDITIWHYPKGLSPNAAKIARSQLLKFRADVCIPLFSWEEALLWPVALQYTGIPLVYSEHSNPAIIEREKMTREERLSVFAAADRSVLLLPVYLNSLPPFLRSKSCAIGNAIQPAKKTANCAAPYNGRFRCIALGRFVENVKQFTLLVEAFQRLISDFPQWDLYIYGDGKDRDKMHSAVNQDLINKRIFFPGMTNDPEKEYCRSHLFCIPSRYEGFGMTVAEALSHSLPAVGFAECSGVNSLIRNDENGLLASHMTVASLADALAVLMKNAALREQMGKCGQETVKKYAPETIYDTWEDLLISVAKLNGRTHLVEISKKLEPANLNKDIFKVNTKIDNIYASLSWKISRPLRMFSNFKR